MPSKPKKPRGLRYYLEELAETASALVFTLLDRLTDFEDTKPFRPRMRKRQAMAEEPFDRSKIDQKLAIDPTPLVPSAWKARLIHLCSLYHQIEGEEAWSQESRMTKSLKSSEQPYVRKLVIGKDWVPLETGWIGDKCSLLVIENRERGDRKLVELTNSISEDPVGQEHAPFTWMVHPGDHFSGTPRSLRALFIRSVEGEAKITIIIFPE